MVNALNLNSYRINAFFIKLMRMKLKLITLATLSLVTTFSWGQTLLYNNGATVKIQAGATLYVEGGVHNTSTGTLDNDGIFEIKGNLLNEGTWEATEPNTVKFSGNANSDVTSGTAQLLPRYLR